MERLQQIKEDKEYEERIKQDIENLRYICKKIIQAYRIRLMCFGRRHKLLVSIEHNFDNISKNPNFYSILDTNLKRERKVLEIARRGSEEAESNILYAIKQLEEYKKKYGVYAQETHLKRGHGPSGPRISGGDILKFLIDMIEFLNLMQNDLLKIEKRILVEENFLKKRNRNSENFDKFILAWEDEMKANEKLVKHFRRILRSNKKFIRYGEREGKVLMTCGGLFGIGAAQVGVAIGSPIFAVGGGVIGVVYVMIGLLAYIDSFVHEELVNIYKDEKLLKHLEEVKAIKKPFWKKMFGE